MQYNFEEGETFHTKPGIVILQYRSRDDNIISYV